MSGFRQMRITLLVLGIIALGLVAVLWPRGESEMLEVSMPTSAAGDEEKYNFAGAIVQVAQSTDAVNLKDCTLSPFVARVREGYVLTIHNQDSSSHQIRMLGFEDELPARGGLKILGSLANGPGLYTVLCDLKIAGFLEIVDQGFEGGAGEKREITVTGREDLRLEDIHLYFISPNSYPRTITLNGVELALPLPGTKDDEFRNRVTQMAVETNKMFVKEDCSLSPQVASVEEGSQFTFINRDAEKHLVVIHGEEVEIPGEGEKTITASFKSGPSLYGIKCDSFVHVVGFIETKE